jgi:hypothetical protein
VVALVFFVFAAFVALVFFVFVVAVEPESCANTGIASENAIIIVNNTERSFFMLGLDLLGNNVLPSKSKAGAIPRQLL